MVKQKTSQKPENPRQWISLHYNNNHSLPKLVIHTTQLSGAIENDFLQKIAQKVKDFAEEKGIKF